MATNREDPVGFWDRLQSVPRQWLFVILIVTCSVPLFFDKLTVPNKPDMSTMDVYKALVDIPDGSTVLVESDWTISTRGESGGQFEALIRILMRKNVKFALYSFSDAQAPQVSRDVIDRLSIENEKAGGKRYKVWEDYVVLGFFANAENTANAMKTNIRQAIGINIGDNTGQQRSAFDSPVLKDIKTIKDLPMLCMVTSTDSLTIVLTRLASSIKIGAFVTGVMVPEAMPYWASGQLVGVSPGLKGVYDLETLMENGINMLNADGKVVVVGKDKFNGVQVPGFPGKSNFGRGKIYYPTLHAAMLLMVMAVVIGNVAMVMSRKARMRS